MSSSCYVVKDSPQPQLPLELGLLKTNSDLQSAQRQSAPQIPIRKQTQLMRTACTAIDACQPADISESLKIMTHIIQASAATRPDIQPAPHSLRQDLIPVTQQGIPSNAGSIRPGRWIYSQPLFCKALQNSSIYSTCHTCESLLCWSFSYHSQPWRAGTGTLS